MRVAAAFATNPARCPNSYLRRGSLGLHHGVSEAQENCRLLNRRPLWIAESATLQRQVYPADAVIGKEYVFANKAVVEDRLSKAGIRLAAYLNLILN